MYRAERIAWKPRWNLEHLYRHGWDGGGDTGYSPLALASMVAMVKGCWLRQIREVEDDLLPETVGLVTLGTQLCTARAGKHHDWRMDI